MGYTSLRCAARVRQLFGFVGSGALRQCRPTRCGSPAARRRRSKLYQLMVPPGSHAAAPAHEADRLDIGWPGPDAGEFLRRPQRGGPRTTAVGQQPTPARPDHSGRSAGARHCSAWRDAREHGTAASWLDATARPPQFSDSWAGCCGRGIYTAVRQRGLTGSSPRLNSALCRALPPAGLLREDLRTPELGPCVPAAGAG
jgi:hypothetical protein